MSDRELSTIDKLVKTEENTNSDGTVNVTIDGWEESNDGEKVIVQYITPTGEQKSDTLDFPQPGGDLSDYKFYRLVQNCGYSMRNADLIEGEQVRAKNSASWRLVVPDNTTTVEETKSRLNGAIEAFVSVDWGTVIIVTVWLAMVLTILAGVLSSI